MLAEVAAAEIAVVEIRVVSSNWLPPAMLTTANSSVPALFMASTTSLDCVAFTVPSVAEDGTVRLAGVPDTVVTVPLPSVVERKSNTKADAEIVKAFAATDADIG